MKKHFLICIAALVCTLTFPLYSISQAPDWTRLVQLNTYGFPLVRVVTADANYVYMAVRFNAPCTFEGVNYTPVGYADMLLVKSSNAGVTQWVKQFNTQAGNYIGPDALKIDAAGNIYLAGAFSGTITIGSSTITSDPTKTAFLAKFDASGNGLWASPFLGMGNGSSEIALDGTGNSFLMSYSRKLIKFNNSGVNQWEQTYLNRTLQAIAIYGSNLYIGGALQPGTTTFGTIPLTSLGGYNTGYLLKADLNGNYTGSLVVGGSTSGDGSCISDIVLDNSGNLVITGGYVKDLILGTVTVSNPGTSHYTFIAKCNGNFDFTWAKSSTSLTDNYRTIWTYRVFMDNSGNIYELGMNSCCPVTFGGITISVNCGNQFLVKFDPDGNATEGHEIVNASFDRTIVTPEGKLLNGYVNAAGITGYGNFGLTLYDNSLAIEWQAESSNSSAGSAAINYIKHDQAGNTYVQARVSGNLDYFGTNIQTNSYITVISKHDITGALVWMKQIRDQSLSFFGSSFTLDKDNNVLTMGLFHESLDIGTTTLTSLNSEYECYVAKYNSNGVFLWASKLNLGNNFSSVSKATLATDHDGNVLVSGPVAPDNFLVKFSASGNRLWAKTFPMESYYFSLCVSTDASNNIYLTSEIHLENTTGTTTIGSVVLNQTGSDGATALVKFDPDGNALWARTYGGVAGATYADSWACDINTDAAGNTYLWGWCPNNATFGTVTFTNPFPTSQYSYYLAKINTSGDVVWAKPVYETQNGNNYGDLLDLDQLGNVYVGGHFKNKINIDGTEYLPEGTNDFFTLKYSGSGDFQWIKTIPSNSFVSGTLSVMGDNKLSIGGAAGKNATLGRFNFIKKNGSNCIIATLGPVIQSAPVTTAAIKGAPAGTGVHIPVTVTGFETITAVNLRLEYNPGVLTFNGYSNANTELSGLLVNDLPVSASLRKVLISWADINPITLVPGSKLLDLDFTYLSGTTSLTWNNTDNGGGDCEYADSLGNPLPDIPTTQFYTNGEVHLLPAYPVSGIIKYNNVANTPLDLVKIVLRQNSVPFDSVFSNASGEYTFALIPDGIYTTHISSTKAWGGVNATDAIKVQRHAVGLEPLTEPVRLLAADVNFTNSINATDAVKIKRRAVGLDTTFARGNWTFAKPVSGGDTILVNGGNVSQDYYGLCVGDVNASHTPSPGDHPNSVSVIINHNGEIAVSPGQEFILPVRVSNAILVNAISMVIPYPAELLEVLDITTPAGNPAYTAMNGEIRIAWSELQTLELNAGDMLFLLKLKATDLFTGNLAIELVATNESELADETGTAIPFAQLFTQTIKTIGLTTAMDPNSILRQCTIYPNPASDVLNIELNTMQKSHLDMEIIDMLGRVIIVKQMGELMHGINSFRVNTSDLGNGVYTIKLGMDSENGKLSYMYKVVIGR